MGNGKKGDIYFVFKRFRFIGRSKRRIGVVGFRRRGCFFILSSTLFRVLDNGKEMVELSFLGRGVLRKEVGRGVLGGGCC